MNPKIKFYHSLISIVLISSLSCGSLKVVPEVQQNLIENHSYNVVLTIKRKVPYCGGAVPTYEMANKTKIEINKDFVIQYQQGYGDSLWFKECKTDSLGMISFNLPNGKYCLKRANKNIPFDDFYKMHKKENDDYHLYRDRTCFYDWWKRCNLTFELNEEIKTIVMEVIINSRCYTGENPCVIYLGPYPP